MHFITIFSLHFFREFGVKYFNLFNLVLWLLHLVSRIFEDHPNKYTLLQNYNVITKINLVRMGFEKMLSHGGKK